MSREGRKGSMLNSEALGMSLSPLPTSAFTRSVFSNHTQLYCHREIRGKQGAQRSSRGSQAGRWNPPPPPPPFPLVVRFSHARREQTEPTPKGYSLPSSMHQPNPYRLSRFNARANKTKRGKPPLLAQSRPGLFRRAILILVFLEQKKSGKKHDKTEAKKQE